jgi:hypothetical protein
MRGDDMTGDNEDVSIHAIEIGRRLGRSLAAKLQEQGVTQEDATIAAIYSAVDLASDFTGSQISGIEWLRSALDVMERQIMSGGSLRAN